MNVGQLKIIINNIESGRWDFPLNRMYLAEVIPSTDIDYWVDFFTPYEMNQFSKQQIVLALKPLLNELPAVKNDEHHLELVWTGPSTPNSTLRDTGVVVQELFRNAKEEVIIAGFAFYQGDEIFKELAATLDSNSNFKVTFFVDIRKDQKASEDAAIVKFKTDFKNKQWPGEKLPDVYYDPRTLLNGTEKRSSMHAKCIIVDSKKLFITSANFTEAAHERNIEAGVLMESSSHAIELRSQFLNLVEVGVMRKLC